MDFLRPAEWRFPIGPHAEWAVSARHPLVQNALLHDGSLIALTGTSIRDDDRKYIGSVVGAELLPDDRVRLTVKFSTWYLPEQLEPDESELDE